MKNVTSMNDLISIQEIKQEASATFLSSEIDKYIAIHKTSQ